VDTPLLSPDQLDRYLGLLGAVAAPPSVAHLDELIQAHLTRVPFENVSKLLQRRAGQRGLPELDAWLASAGIGREGALLVRPDQHVAWRSPGAAPDPRAAFAATFASLLGG